MIGVACQLQYDVWYKCVDSKCYTYVKVFRAPDSFPQENQVAFIAHMIDSRDGHLSLYAPPKWQWKPNPKPEGWFPAKHVTDGRHPSGPEWLEFAEKQIETNQWKIADPQPKEP